MPFGVLFMYGDSLGGIVKPTKASAWEVAKSMMGFAPKGSAKPFGRFFL